MNRRILTIMILISALLVLLVPAASADVVFSNYPDNGVYGGWCNQVALGFTVPDDQNYQLNSVRMGLRHIIDDSVTLHLYSDDDGKPGEALQAIDTRTVRQHHTYNFSANTAQLEAGETYWLYVDASACNVTWDDIGERAPRGDFSIVGYMRFTNEWVDASDSGRLMPSLVLDAITLGG